MLVMLSRLFNLPTVDLTMQKETPDHPVSVDAALIQLDGESDPRPLTDPELGVRRSRNSLATGSGTSTPRDEASIPSSRLTKLVADFNSSSIAQNTKDEILEAKRSASANGHTNGDAVILGSYERAGRWEQFTILSGRSFKNLYRDPMLMLSHYAVSVAVACA